MRIFKLTLITLAAVIAFSASAWSITVKKRIEAPGLPNEVWAVAGADFCAIKAWHPAVVECVKVKGFSTRRCLWFARKNLAIEKWLSVGVEIITASTKSTMSSKLLNVLIE